MAGADSCQRHAATWQTLALPVPSAALCPTFLTWVSAVLFCDSSFSSLPFSACPCCLHCQKPASLNLTSGFCTEAVTVITGTPEPSSSGPVIAQHPLLWSSRVYTLCLQSVQAATMAASSSPQRALLHPPVLPSLLRPTWKLWPEPALAFLVRLLLPEPNCALPPELQCLTQIRCWSYLTPRD